MEKAVLKTLIYSDIFDYPLKAWEIHKWLIGEKCDMIQVEKALKRLILKKQVIYKNDLFALSGRESLLSKRKATLNPQNLKRLQLITTSLKVIPWIKMVGIYGDWSMKKIGRRDPVKLLVVTSGNKLGISKTLIEGVLAGVEKIFLNQVIYEEELEFRIKNLFTAHEVLQMQLIWQREGIYTTYLNDNSWVFKFLPNWTTSH